MRHSLGEPCDICNGRGFDYLGRECRRMQQPSDTTAGQGDDGHRTRALLIGGPFDFRTVRVLPNQTEVRLVLPTETPIAATVDALEPLALDLRVATYTLQGPIHDGQRLAGMIYRYEGTR